MGRAIHTFFVILIAVEAFAGDGEQHVIAVDDYFKLGYLQEIAMSSAAKGVAYTEGRWQESTNDRKTDIWVAPMSGAGPRRLTFDRAGYDTLRWSRDGKWLYCTSQSKRAGEKKPPHDGSRQIWRIALDGAGVVPITTVVGGIGNFELSADGESIIYTKASDEDEGEWKALRSKFSEVEYGTRKKTKTVLVKLDLNTWQTTPIKEYAGAIDGFAISPDGMRIAMIAASDGEVITMEGGSEVAILDVSTGATADLPDEEWRKNLPSPYGRLWGPVWSADSQALAFAVGFDAYPSEIFVATWTGQAAPQIRKVSRPGEVSLHGGVDGGGVLQWRGKSHDLLFLGDDRARVRIYCANNVTAGGPIDSITDGDVVVSTFVTERASDGAAAIIARPDRMQDVYSLDGNEWKQLTDIHSHTRDWALPKISVVKWLGHNGDQVEGILELPADYEAGNRLPLVVNLHGGPTSAWPCEMLFGFTGSILYAGQGYAFFSPNYHGSTGYGDEFITDLVGRENGIEVDDILKGVDQLIADGIVDQDRVAVAGWSNGGYLTNCLISTTDRFKAASSGAGIAEKTMEWGTNDEPAFTLVFAGGTPWQVPDAYRRASPIFNFGQVKTPTLFHVGENDMRCPRGQSEMAFRALKKYLNIDSELLVYPGEGHSLRTYSNRKAKMTWELAWFDHYLKGKPSP